MLNVPDEFVSVVKSEETKLLENPSWKFWKKISSVIPRDIRFFIKDYKFWLPIDFVKWLLIDLQRPKYFHPYGLVFYCGLAGAGKTMHMSKTLMDFREKYGDSIYIGTNYGFLYEDFEVNSYSDIIELRDKPTIIGYDEIQNDFDARNWATLSASFSERINQSRKMRGLMILCTAQKFGFVDKRLRQLTNRVHECKTFKERLTFSRILEPEVKEKLEGGFYTEMNSVRSRGFTAFVQSDYIRGLYDSFQILENMRNRLDEALTKPERVIRELQDLLHSGETPSV
ncbi:MAG: hypothetical protein RBT49_15665 [Bacteroidales bacterium]|jgi:hypothetical protein|nr:hypothetical protein [Bacteroidales bacterium]